MITCTRMLDQSVFNLQIKNLAVVAFCVKLLDCKDNELVMQTSMIINLILQQLCLKLTAHSEKANELRVTLDVIRYSPRYVYFGDWSRSIKPPTIQAAVPSTEVAVQGMQTLQHTQLSAQCSLLCPVFAENFFFFMLMGESQRFNPGGCSSYGPMRNTRSGVRRLSTLKRWAALQQTWRKLCIHHCQDTHEVTSPASSSSVFPLRKIRALEPELLSHLLLIQTIDSHSVQPLCFYRLSILKR